MRQNDLYRETPCHPVRTVTLLLILGSLLIASVDAQGRRSRPVVQEDSGFPQIQLQGSMRAIEAISLIADRLPEVAAWYGTSVPELQAAILRDHDLWMDARGRLFYGCSGLIAAGDTAGASEPTAAYATYPMEQTFLLHSRPQATRVIYLDFDGHVTSGTYWNSNYTGGADIVSSPFDLDGNNTSFNATELERIQYIWMRVAEDFRPFDVDVTTEDPGIERLRKSSAADLYHGIRVVISPDRDWFGNYGGVAYYNSFSWSTDTPCFVFSSGLANAEKYIAEACSHESGHSVGLHHDGATNGTEYYAGHGNWAPIMGNSYYRDVTQWSRGEYAGANNTEDDLSIMRQVGGFDYIPDDHADAAGGSTTLAGVSFTSNGHVIERNTDIDAFNFTTGAGNIAITINPADRGPNLDVLAELYDSTGTLMLSSNPAGLPATLSALVAAGNYYLNISGVGTGDPSVGYSDYASLGAYQVTGTLVDPGTLQAPTAVADAQPASGVAPLLVSFSGVGSADPDGQILEYFWTFGDGNSSSELNPVHSYQQVGNFTATLTVTDDDGLTGSDSVLVTVLAPPNEPPTAVASASPISGYNPLTVSFSSSESYDSDGTISTNSWNFGDGTSSEQSNPDHIYDWPGTYTATLTVVDNDGAQASDSVSINVQQDPARMVHVGSIQMALASVPGGRVAQATVLVLDTNDAPVAGATVSGEWSGLVSGASSGATNGAGFVTLESRKSKATGLFTFTVLNVAAPGYGYAPGDNLVTSASISTEQSANQLPLAVISSNPSTGPAPLQVVLDGSGSYDPDGSIVSYSWDFGDGSTGTNLQVTHLYNNAGAYSVVLSVTDDRGATASATVAVNVTSDNLESMHVSGILMGLVSVPGGTAAEAFVTVVDSATGSPLPGAVVTGSWSGYKSGTVQGTTGTDGTVRFQSPKARGSFSYTFSVTDVVAPGYLYDHTQGLTSSSITGP